MKKGCLLFALIICCGLIAVCLKICEGTTVETDTVVFSERVIYTDEEHNVIISEGISIGGIAVGGMTVDDARSALLSGYDESKNGEVLINRDNNTIKTTLQELGLSWGLEEALQTAARMSDRGNGIIGYLTQMDLKYGNFQIDLAWSLDHEAVYAFVVSQHKTGRLTDRTATVNAILKAFYSMENDDQIIVDAVVVEAAPKYTTEVLDQIQDCLGEKGTIYLSEGNPRTERCVNVEVGTAYIDGTVLLPGESVSTSTLMKPRTEENGYKTGGQMVNGQIEDAIGGGVCQVSTTLYNALLEAEVQIDERNNHSMEVSYVKPSEDAAIATGSKDLIFTNNLEYPIYIQGTTNGNQVVFRVFGKEVRPSNRTLEFVSVEEKRIVSETIEIEDPDMPMGTRSEETGTNHDEVWSHLEKVVYVDGVETERYTLHSDYYAPSQATVKVGTAPVETTAAESADTGNDSGSDDGGEE